MFMKNRAKLSTMFPKDFQLISNQNKFNISSFLLCSFSNRINQLFIEDPLIDFYEIQSINHDISPIISFIEGDDDVFSKVSTIDVQNLLLCAFELGINEIIEILEPKINYYEMTIEQLLIFLGLAYKSNVQISTIVKAITFRLSSIKEENLINKIPIPIFSMILNVSGYSITSETDLIPTIVKEYIDPNHPEMKRMKRLIESKKLKVLSV